MVAAKITGSRHLQIARQDLSWEIGVPGKTGNVPPVQFEEAYEREWNHQIIALLIAAALMQPPHDAFREVAEDSSGVGHLGLDLDQRRLAGVALVRH